MTTPFPDRTPTGQLLVPTTRRFTAGIYPTKTYRSLSGTSYRRNFGNTPAGFGLDLTYRNILDDSAALILEHYRQTYGGFLRFPIPDALLRGMSLNLQLYVKAPFGILWDYSAPPEVESVFNNRSTVSIQLNGEIDV
jgi:hypothetical protein